MFDQEDLKLAERGRNFFVFLRLSNVTRVGWYRCVEIPAARKVAFLAH